MSSTIRHTLQEVIPRLSTNDEKLPYVDLTGQWIGDEGAKELAAALKDNTCITVIFLPYNRIGPVGASALAGALRGLSQIEEIYIGQNRIGNEGAKAFASLLTLNNKLRVLDLSNNQITDRTALLVNGETSKKQLDLLGLLGNPIREEQVTKPFEPTEEVLHFLCHDRTRALIENGNKNIKDTS